MNTAPTNPLALIAELTHRCPLHCVYCSNPLELQTRAAELDTQTWCRVFREAAAAGVLQADFTGGEPLTRPDIVDLVRAARTAGLYVSLITSGLLVAKSFTVISFASTFTAVIGPALVTNVPNTTSSAVTFTPSSLFCPRARSWSPTTRRFPAGRSMTSTTT